MSVGPREFEMLRAQKAAEERAAAAERKAESLEKSLTFAVEHLANFIIEYTEGTEDALRNFVSPASLYESAKQRVPNVADRSDLALKLFAGYPAISDSALTTLGVDDETIAKWRKWKRGFDQKPTEHWIEGLWKVLDGRIKPVDAQMPEFLRECLTAANVDVDKAVAEVHHQKAQQFFRENPTDFGERGRSLQQAGKLPHVYIENPFHWLE